MKSIQLYAAGGCLDTSGPGGYGAVLVFGEHRMELSGGYRITTTSRMELMSISGGWGPCMRRARPRSTLGPNTLSVFFPKGGRQSGATTGGI